MKSIVMTLILLVGLIGPYGSGTGYALQRHQPGSSLSRIRSPLIIPLSYRYHTACLPLSNRFVNRDDREMPGRREALGIRGVLDYCILFEDLGLDYWYRDDSILCIAHP